MDVRIVACETRVWRSDRDKECSDEAGEAGDVDHDLDGFGIPPHRLHGQAMNDLHSHANTREAIEMA